MTLFPPLFADEATGMSPKPVDLFSIGGFPVNNSMIAETIACIAVIVVIQIAMRKPQLVPSGMQNFIEWLVELLSNFIESLAGRKTMERGFWYFGSLFVFILAENLLALFPGTGTVGYGHGTNIWNFEVTHPFLRGANANVNATAAYTAIFFFMYFYWCWREAGIRGSLFHVFGSKAKFANKAVDILFIIIFFVVGWIEVFSILIIRPIAFTFRLFGNIYGGEYLLDSMYKLAPNFAFIILVPFYFYELLVAFVQTFVIFALTAAFTGIITNAGDHASEESGAH
ncbi:MAG: F0F1 ATP synthase subunit A [Methylacidiphilales bacterium]|nr:F0F1 ATP synthase subunit A [Candidatus Methylacidiphilales bacterium]